MFKYSNLTQEQLEDLAFKLAEQFQNRSAVIGLIGVLGSGKTTFTKAFSKKFKVKEIKSPTFVISHQHKIGKRWLYHFDFYRLEEKKQLIPLGLSEILPGDNLVLIEWVDRFPEISKQCDILINLKVKKGNKRDVTIKSKK